MVVDLAVAFDGRSAEELIVNDLDVHPNARTHGEVAALIADELRRSSVARRSTAATAPDSSTCEVYPRRGRLRRPNGSAAGGRLELQHRRPPKARTSAAVRRARVARDVKTTFAGHYSKTVSLVEALQPKEIAIYAAKATGEKYLIAPSRG
jgi:hypothetical protein